MNLNNKYLAIGLSIAAAAIVGYQIFINKPGKPVRQQFKSEPMFSTTGKSPGAKPASLSTSTATQPPGQQEKSDQGLIIDYHSEILLKRIPTDLVAGHPKKELPQEFGGSIFSRGETREEQPSTGPQYEREIEFKLNAIIIDEKRRIAIINDTILKVGDIIQGAEVTAIVKSKVVLKIKKEQVVLSTNARVKKVRLIGGGKGE